MNQAKIQYFENVKLPYQRDFINAHNNCILCGNVLELQHIRTDEQNEIREQAHCAECEVKTRNKSYTLN